MDRRRFFARVATQPEQRQNPFPARSGRHRFVPIRCRGLLAGSHDPQYPVSALRKQAFERGQVALTSRSGKGLEKAPPFSRARGRVTPCSDMLTSPDHELARIRFFKFEDFGNLSVGVIERFAKNISGSFRGRKPLEQQQDGELQSLTAHGSRVRVAAGIHRLGVLRPGVHLAARMRGLSGVEGQPRGCRGEEREGIEDRTAIGGLPPHPDILDDILGLGCAAKNAASNPVEAGTGA